MKKNIFHFSLYLTVFLNVHFSNAQFPNPVTLSTGQGTPGTQDPIWQCSPWSTVVPGNPMGETFGPTLINNNCAPGAWVDPASLPPPMNNGNWITGTESNCATNTNAGYRYFRLTLNLPPDCNGFSVTDQGNYILSFDGYVDNFIHDVFINGNSQGISGGGFGPGNQLNIYLDGPWVVGVNYVDILVFNAFTSPPGAQNPYGLLLVADGTSSASMDLDNDGVSDLDDLCPCDAGPAPLGCPLPSPNTCDVDLIRSTFLGAGCLELPLCYSDCSMYFLNPSPNSGSSAQAFAQIYGANLISVQDAAENQCILDELIRIGESGVIWIGFNDEAVEGDFVWYDQSPVVYTNWAPGEPNNSGGNEDCTQIYPNGTWNDLNCNTANAKSIIEVNLCPVISAPDVIVCANETTVVAADNPILGSHPYTFSWDNGPTTQSQTVPTIDASYVVVVTDRYNCSGSDTSTVTTKVVPTASVSPNDTLICSGEQTAFVISSDISGTSFVWTEISTAVSGSADGNGDVISQTLSTTTSSNGSVTYSITPTYDGCEGALVDAVVTVSPIPNLTFSPSPAIICEGDVLPITVDGAHTYSWSPNLGLNIDIGATVDASPTTTQTYTVVGTNTSGCDGTGNVTITVNSLPTATILGTVTVCQGDPNQTITFTGVNGTSEYTFTYTLNGGTPQTITTSGGNNVTISVPTTTPGTFVYVLLSVEDTATGCSQPQTGTATVIVNPVINTTDNVQLCNYDLPFLWNGQTITSGGNGIATHTTQDANGCDVTTTLNLTITDPPNVSFAVTADVCIPSQVIMTPSSVEPSGNCIWYVSGQQVTGDCSGATFTEVNSGCQTVELVATDVNGCITTVTVNDAYCISPLPEALFQLSQLSNTMMQTINQSTNATSYLWVLPNGTTTTELNPLILFEQILGESVLTLFAYSDVGCIDSMSVVIDWPFIVPNVITANGDGVNDHFIIAGLAPNSRLTILNRWGNLIYTSDNYDNTWDGRDAKGNYVVEGVYSYILELQNGTKQHGFIHIER